MGSGYVRSSHMKPDVGPQKSGGFTPGFKGHTGTNASGEKNAWVKSPRPNEAQNRGRKGIPTGDTFESQIKNSFKSGGPAGITPKAMPHNNSPTPSEAKSDKHGKASGKSEHMPHPTLTAHKFSPPPATNFSCFGHRASQKAGPLRLSGNRSAHRVGSRSR